MTEATLSASLEDYLEAIFHIVERKQAARPKDIARRLKVGSSSVTGALKALAARELVNYAPYDIVTLTPEGESIARDVVRRHEALREFFTKVLAAEPKLADEAACLMEHAVPAELVDRFVRFIEFVEMCPRGGPGLLEGFRVHLAEGCRPSCFDECPVRDLEISPAGPPRGARVVVTLDELQPGQKARVRRVQGEGALRRRLMDLGLLAGVEVEMERSAPLGDPLEVLVRGNHLSLRRREAASVELEIES